MIVDLADHEERGTFELAGGGRVHLRLLSPEDLKAMREACLTTVVEYPWLGEGPAAKYHRFESSRFDDEQWTKLHWDRVIVGWEHLYDREHRPIPVTVENKRLLMERVPAFAEAVRAGIAALKEAEQSRAEVREKNSSSGSVGSTTHSETPGDSS